MPIKYALTSELRLKLKHPLGMLIRGSFIETMKRFSEMAQRGKTSSIIAVGDTVSKNLAQNNIVAKLIIIDNKCMRKTITPLALAVEKTVCVKNPQGTITDEAIAAIQEALQSRQNVKIIVEGEEDLLTLIAIMEAPQGSFVLYGQPREGMVVVKVSPSKKTEVSEILNAMEKARKTK